MKVQGLYNLREQTAFCSGSELTAFFRRVLLTPSPSGDREIDSRVVKRFIRGRVRQMIANSPSTGRLVERECRQARFL